MEPAILMIAVGALFLGALVLDTVGRIVHVPRVTLLILLGAVLGPPGLDVLPDALADGNEAFAAVALTMVAFLLGGSLERRSLAGHGRDILSISIAVVVVSAVTVVAALVWAGAPVVVALALAGISGATDPAATRDVVRQSGRRKGRFAGNLLGVVAIDDAWGLLMFSILLTIADLVAGGGGTADAIRIGLWEVGGGLALGLAVGLPAALLTGRLKRGEPSLLEALGVVLICAGLALYLGVSYLLAGMVAGATVVNLARHHSYPFHEIERIEWPFVLLFFIMAGSLLDLGLVGDFGLVGVAYLVARLAARVLGGWLGARVASMGAREGMLMGIALTPQAGVAIGMALVAAGRFPAYGDQIIAITIASTIVFELIGPILTQLALSRAPDDP